MDISEYRKFFGPYNDRPGRWVVYGVRRDTGKRDPFIFRDEAEAQKTARIWRDQLGGTPILSLQPAIENYEKHLKQKGDRERSIAESIRRLKSFFPTLDMLLFHVDEKKCRAWNDAVLATTKSADTKINHLNTAKTFLRWCVDTSVLKANPMEKIKPVGRRKKGKEQLRIDEAKRWLRAASEMATEGHDGAVAAMIAYVVGLRASEVITRNVRDIDDDGRIIWVEKQVKAGFDTKTGAGRRQMEIPEYVRPFTNALIRGRAPDAYLFPGRYGRKHRSRNWVLGWVRGLCILAGVPMVCTHAMRGLHGSLAVESGMTGHAVAAAMGHESFQTTVEHYAGVASLEKARAERAHKKMGVK